MVLQINGKALLDCNAEDIQLIKDNPSFKENNYIDYKGNFPFLEIQDKKIREEKKIEFRNDVCSFANAEGGYLLYGIKENQGIPVEINGIIIPNNNTDKFELDLRNALLPIEPRIPNINFKFIELSSGNFVVIIYVSHDFFAPYTHIENQINYKFFKRTGNEKATMTYTEIRDMFNRSLSLDKEIISFRKDRINHYTGQSERIEELYSKFLLFHIIPENFLEHDYDQDMFVIQKTKKINFSSIFNGFHCSDTSIPCANGIRFIPHFSNTDKAECYLYNNGTIECFLDLKKIVDENNNYPNGYIPRDYIWEMIQETCDNYIKYKGLLCHSNRLFLCLDIVGCKGVISQTPSEDGVVYYSGTIDRNTLICEPVVITDTSDDTMFNNMIKKLHLNYLLSIGVKFGKGLDNLINELYS